MTNDQKIRLRLSQVRGRLNDIAGIEDLTDEIRSEAEALHTELNDLSIRERALIPSEGITETRDTGLDAEARERLELRSKASLTAYIRAALSGRQVDGPEAELRSAAKIGVSGDPARALGRPGRSRHGDPPGCPHSRAGGRRQPGPDPSRRVRGQHRADARVLICRGWSPGASLRRRFRRPSRLARKRRAARRRRRPPGSP